MSKKRSKAARKLAEQEEEEEIIDPDPEVKARIVELLSPQRRLENMGTLEFLRAGEHNSVLEIASHL